RTEILVVGLPHAAGGADSGRGDASRVMSNVAAGQVSKLCHDPVILGRRPKAFPAEPQIESQTGSDLPIVLTEHRVIVCRVMTVGISLVGGRNTGVNGRFFKPWVVFGEIRVCSTPNLSDCPVRLEHRGIRR